jgi:nucleoside-diphosphate-sugar epimerase
MTRWLVVGRGLIGRAVAAGLGHEARLVAHDAIAEPGLLDGVEAVLWAGRHPALGTPDWRLEDDLEPALAVRLAQRGIRLVSLSSRKVYAPADAPLKEGDPVAPADAYGRHKLLLEECLDQLLGPGLTRLRVANVFGFERDPGRRSFMTQMLASLATQGEIHFAMSPSVARDFVSVEMAAAWIAALVRHPPGGIVNLGSGIPLPVGELADWVMEGFGWGRLVVLDPREHDPFVLDVARLHTLLPNARCERDDLRAAALAVGRRLRVEVGRSV